MKITEKIEVFNEDNVEVMKRLSDESIDVICIDPPYLYLKNQKLERIFDEELFFSECKRLLTKNGFIILFGRGSSFYRWNTILADLGFIFKEEIIWDKSYVSSPATPISRCHETIAIFSKNKGKINADVTIPYLETKTDISSIHSDLKRIKSALNNNKEFNDIELYLNEGITNYHDVKKSLGRSLTVQTRLKERSRGLSTVKAIKEGMRIKSIVRERRNHFNTIHPTQKPVRLIENLLKLVIPKNKEPRDIMVADFFGGSFSAMEAVYNMGMQGIACEIDEEYYGHGIERLMECTKQLELTE